MYSLSSKKGVSGGRLGGSAVERLPLAQVMILGSGIESHIRLPAGSLLLPQPVFLTFSLSESLMNKLKKYIKKNTHTKKQPFLGLTTSRTPTLAKIFFHLLW